MNAPSEMSLTLYQVLKLSFELNEQFSFTSKPKKPILILPQFARHVNELDPNRFSIHLSVLIANEFHEEPIPFQAEVQIQGFFEMQNWNESKQKDQIIDNATAILFPYLRSLLSNMTLQGNVPAYVLPITNISNLFRDTQ